MNECQRDPNIKTKEDPRDDIRRILQIRDYKKLFVDTAVTTTHFLKNCVRVRKFTELSNSEKLMEMSEGDVKNQLLKENQTACKRGAMNFEDFCYEMYNQYILIDPDFKKYEFDFGEDDDEYE